MHVACTLRVCCMCIPCYALHCVYVACMYLCYMHVACIMLYVSCIMLYLVGYCILCMYSMLRNCVALTWHVCCMRGACVPRMLYVRVCGAYGACMLRPCCTNAACVIACAWQVHYRYGACHVAHVVHVCRTCGKYVLCILRVWCAYAARVWCMCGACL